MQISKNNLEVDLRGKLADIMKHKVAELEQQKTTKCCRDFAGALKNASGIGLIAEIKRASPSLGEINMSDKVEERARAYEFAGADAISVITDSSFFNGDISFLRRIRAAVGLPLLRKDFIFDEYQIYESKFYGADAVLLIASILRVEQLRKLLGLARTLGMSSLVEIHTIDDAKKAVSVGAEMVGINSRDLRSFEINLGAFSALAPFLSKDKILIAESGIENGSQSARLRDAGANCILVGTTLMRSDNLAEKIHELKLL